MHRVQLLVSLLVIVLLASLGGGSFASHTNAQDATPEALPPVLIAWSEAWDALDPDALAALYTEDGIYEDVASGMVAQGRSEIAASLGEIMAGIAESQNEPVSGFSTGDMAVMEFQITAVDAASGKTFTFRGVLVAELDGDLIRSSREYYDVATILGQLGLMGGDPSAAATPTT
jgi:steroid delta-isomerase-like uncharacterized protein